MIAFYIVGRSMKTLRNALFVDLTNSIVRKMAVMTTIATEERAGLKRCFVTFLSFLVLKRWFANKKESELLRCHKGKHKQDAGMIRHPADATQW
jgi:hypothetical protein